MRHWRRGRNLALVDTGVSDLQEKRTQAWVRRDIVVSFGFFFCDFFFVDFFFWWFFFFLSFDWGLFVCLSLSLFLCLFFSPSVSLFLFVSLSLFVFVYLPYESFFLLWEKVFVDIKTIEKGKWEKDSAKREIKEKKTERERKIM